MVFGTNVPGGVEVTERTRVTGRAKVSETVAVTRGDGVIG